MLDFARRTGLDPASGEPGRYLWTDAFAVCNFLELGRSTGERRYTDLALRLVDQVHDVLGRHRADGGRGELISGLSEDEGREHPTAGGCASGRSSKSGPPASRWISRRSGSGTGSISTT